MIYKWEYLWICGDTNMEEALNKAGRDCWELVSVCPLAHYYIAVFKRPITGFKLHSKSEQENEQIP